MKTQEETLAEYARLIEGRWRTLSDGERLRLMAMCCKLCGSVKRCEHDACERGAS